MSGAVASVDQTSCPKQSQLILVWLIEAKTP
jgi:hypothetical protein